MDLCMAACPTDHQLGATAQTAGINRYDQAMCHACGRCRYGTVRYSTYRGGTVGAFRHDSPRHAKCAAMRCAAVGRRRGVRRVGDESR
jgi:ferredoxin